MFAMYFASTCGMERLTPLLWTQPLAAADAEELWPVFSPCEHTPLVDAS